MQHCWQFTNIFIPHDAFYVCVPTLYFQRLTSTQCVEEQIHTNRLSDTLEACNMQKHVVDGDGNCCFSAVAFSLVTNFPLLSDHQQCFLRTSGLDLLADMNTLALQLRQLTVAEWIEHPFLYEGFLSDVCIQEEAPKFLVPGYFYGDLADTMLTALSNTLQTPIIVFSSIACHPFFCVMQTVSTPIMVAFNQWGAGHYDGVIIKEAVTSSAEPVRCGCGKNNTKADTHCHVVKHKCTEVVRCACVKNGTACNVNCRCKNCDNPCGQRSSAHTPRRKRAKHEWQAQTYMNSAEFSQSKQEKISDGPLSKFAFFLLENVYCDEEDIESTSVNVSAIYNKISTSVILDDPNVALQRMTKLQIDAFLRHHQNNFTIFKTFCDMQLHWNRTKEM